MTALDTEPYGDSLMDAVESILDTGVTLCDRELSEAIDRALKARTAKEVHPGLEPRNPAFGRDTAGRWGARAGG